MYRIYFFLFASWLLFSCAGKGSSTATSPKGEDVYKKYCTLCHGSDGKLGVNGSKDLTISQLSEEERVILIQNGKNNMTPFKNVLSPEEIRAVAAYTMTLK